MPPGEPLNPKKICRLSTSACVLVIAGLQAYRRANVIRALAAGNLKPFKSLHQYSIIFTDNLTSSPFIVPVGIDCIHYSWLHACKQNHAIVSFHSYRLPRGPTNISPFAVLNISPTSSSATPLSPPSTNSPKGKVTFSEGRKSGGSVALCKHEYQENLHVLNRYLVCVSLLLVFSNSRFLIFADATWGDIISSAGGTVIPVSDEIKSLIVTGKIRSGSRTSVDYILFDPLVYMESSAASSTNNRKSNIPRRDSPSMSTPGDNRKQSIALSATDVSFLQTIAERNRALNVSVNGISVVSIEWARDCLVVNEIIDPTLSATAYELPIDIMHNPPTYQINAVKGERYYINEIVAYNGKSKNPDQFKIGRILEFSRRNYATAPLVKIHRFSQERFELALGSNDHSRSMVNQLTPICGDGSEEIVDANVIFKKVIVLTQHEFFSLGYKQQDAFLFCASTAWESQVEAMNTGEGEISLFDQSCYSQGF